MSSEVVETPWHAAYPVPRTSSPKLVSHEEVLQKLRDSKGVRGNKHFVLIDLRRNDHKGGTVHGSINLPAQTLYPAIPSLHRLFAAAKIDTVIWYCGSSQGRAPRAAGWFADYLRDEGDTSMESCILVGGIKGWARAGPDYVRMMDGYEASAWREESES